MEQKQLDEMDESFFAEEYLDEEMLDEDFLDELDAKEGKMNSGKETPKENPFASAVKSSSSEEKTKKTSLPKAKETKPLKAASKGEPKASVKAELKQKEEALMDEIVITPVKATSTTKEERVHELKASTPKAEKVSKYVESAPPVDPWADEKKGKDMKESKNTTQHKNNLEVKAESNNAENKNHSEAGLFKDVSTWKALTGITIILLLFSVFTQGFQFSEKAGLGSEPQLTLKEAEVKTVTFVNDNLLTPPFVANVVKSLEIDGLYQITLSVAGQTVDSYLTKDGKIFFPQGLDTSLKLGAPSEQPTSVSPPEAVAPVEEQPTASDSPPVHSAEASSTVSPPAGADSSPVVEIALSAKRWLFNPPTATVKVGSTVVFKIQPENVDFTFSIPELGVQQEVKGPTQVSVVADKTGSFEYTCSSCEDWRGMKGTLLVE